MCYKVEVKFNTEKRKIEFRYETAKENFDNSSLAFYLIFKGMVFSYQMMNLNSRVLTSLSSTSAGIDLEERDVHHRTHLQLHQEDSDLN